MVFFKFHLSRLTNKTIIIKRPLCINLFAWNFQFMIHSNVQKVKFFCTPTKTDETMKKFWYGGCRTCRTRCVVPGYSIFIAIVRRVLKVYFAWKQLKVDYSKNIWKEENRGHGFVCPVVGYISVKKNYRKLEFCWCRSS